MAHFNEKTYNPLRDPDPQEVWAINKGIIKMDGHSPAQDLPTTTQDSSYGSSSGSSSYGSSSSGSSSTTSIGDDTDFTPICRGGMFLAGYVAPLATAANIGLDIAQKTNESLSLNEKLTLFSTIAWITAKLYCSYLTSKNNEQKDIYNDRYLDTLDKCKIVALNTAQFIAFSCVTFYFLKTLGEMSEATPFIERISHERGMLKIASAGASYQIFSAMCKKGKLLVRE